MPFRASFASVVAFAALLSGCGGSDNDQPAAPPASAPTTESQPTASVPETAPAVVTVYFLRDGKVGAASRAVDSGPQIGRAAMLELLEGPTMPERAAGLESSIPAGTKLERLAIDKGVATVHLSQELDPAAAAQVVYTLTQFGTVRDVSIADGEPIDRAELEDFTPPVLVESPLPGDAAASPLRMTGTANTFEATFNVEVLDDEGNVLGKRFVTATSGSGTRGTFDAEVSFKAAAEGRGSLAVFELSAEDGSRIHETKIPLQIRLYR
jgi:germination protein M